MFFLPFMEVQQPPCRCLLSGRVTVLSFQARFKLECLKIKHKTNHFAMRAKLFVKANQMAYEELQKLRAA
ncbi:hypothetical protein CEK71_18440 [Methylovulum psychrotolerans]|uniref:Uncharacterized protein n=1 Tax=Methylovulum psychrotolerans TaxID=1704499 RepID=A0A1Z4C2Z6_9GAMM|nr:hypothetical protein CEK71_18440 [Methylovulum psychrotolerans]